MAKKAKTVAQFKAEAKAIVAKIAAARDELRDLLGQYADILESVEDAERDFESALDRMSELL